MRHSETSQDRLLEPHPRAGPATHDRRDVDAAMEAIEQENPTLKGVLPKEYTRPNLDKTSLGDLIRLGGQHRGR